MYSPLQSIMTLKPGLLVIQGQVTGNDVVRWVVYDLLHVFMFNSKYGSIFLHRSSHILFRKMLRL